MKYYLAYGPNLNLVQVHARSVARMPVWSGIHIYSVRAWSSVVPRTAAF